MKYNLKKPFKAESARAYLEKLIKKGALSEVREIRGKRTIDQNSLYWLYMACLEVETGNNRYELHEFFKKKFIEPIKKNVFGRVIEIRTTTNQDTKLFTIYLNNIVDFALMELNIVMPNPDDKRLLDFYNTYKEFI